MLNIGFLGLLTDIIKSEESGVFQQSTIANKRDGGPRGLGTEGT